jgi:hypothetical protein
MNKTDSKTVKDPMPLKKLSIADLQRVTGAAAGEPTIKITVENESGTSKASGEG